MFDLEDLLKVSKPVPGLFDGGELVQVEENDYQIALVVIGPSEKVGHRIVLPRVEVEQLWQQQVIAPGSRSKS